TETLGATWARDLPAHATVGATISYHLTRLDSRQTDRWTFDVGARRDFGSRLKLAAATHFFSHWPSGDAEQDLDGGIELLVWRGRMWEHGPTGSLLSRYGVAMAHGFEADHLAGAGLEVGDVFAADLLLAREGSLGYAGWRPVGG